MAMYGLAGCREWLHEEVRRIVGVAIADGLLYFAGLEKTAAGWQVACLESVLFAPEEARAASIARARWPRERWLDQRTISAVVVARTFFTIASYFSRLP